MQISLLMCGILRTVSCVMGGVKLTTLLFGAIRAEAANEGRPTWGWLPSMLLSTTLQVLVRTGWQPALVLRVAQAAYPASPSLHASLAKRLLPDRWFFVKAHAQFYVNYLALLATLSPVLVRAFVGQELRQGEGLGGGGGGLARPLVPIGPMDPFKGILLWILTYMDPQDPILYYRCYRCYHCYFVDDCFGRHPRCMRK